MSMRNALVSIDYINEIVHPDGKLAGKGYADFVERHGTANAIKELLRKARDDGWLVLHIRVGFDAAYLSHPEKSPLFGAAKKYKALNLDDWGCEFVDFAQPTNQEVVINKHRVCAFFNTELDMILRINNSENIYFAGCATDLAVQSAVRSAHDRDYTAFVVTDACAAANDEDHEMSLPILAKVSTLINAGEI